MNLISLFFVAVFSPAVPDAAGPSFDCAAAHSVTEKTICADIHLAALDRQLSEAYKSLVQRSGRRDPVLDRDEQRWLHEVRDACTKAACIGNAYEKRIAELRASDRLAGKPADAPQPEPFVTDAVLLSEAQTYIGKHCAPNLPNEATPGFHNIQGFLPIAVASGYVHARSKGAARFAFLLITRDGEASTCRIADVVALPPAKQANAFLYCDASDMPSPGAGLRLAGQRTLVAYWFVDEKSSKLVRQPQAVLDASTSLRCQEPESGD